MTKNNILDLIRFVLKLQCYMCINKSDYCTSGTRTRLWFILDNPELKGQSPIDYIFFRGKLHMNRLKSLDKMLDDAIFSTKKDCNKLGTDRITKVKVKSKR